MTGWFHNKRVFRMMKTLPFGLLAGLLAPLAILGFTWGCSDHTGAKTMGPTVAKVGERDIPALDLEQLLEDRPLVMRDGAVDGAVRKRLDELILEEALFQEAMAQQLDQDPEVRKTIRQLLIGKLIETRVEKPVWEESATPERIRAYYAAHRQEFERPEQVRVADILIAVGQDASADERRALLTKAEKVLAEARVAKDQRGGFSRLIEQHSDTPSHYEKGDTGFIDPLGNLGGNSGGAPAAIDERLAKAAFAIEANGDLAQGVIEADDGYHIIMRVARRSAVHIPLAKVEGNLIQRIRRESLKTERERYLKSIHETAEVHIDEQELAGIIHAAEQARASAGRMEKRRLARSGKENTPPVLRGE